MGDPVSTEPEHGQWLVRAGLACLVISAVFAAVALILTLLT